jgi:hypothetical protein
LRIALHAGPVYSCIDPVTGNPNYIGSQVSHAARIEPVTPPGQVYASQAFAALAAAQRVTVGRLSDLALEKSTPHHLALSYSNCEFGNAVLIFNLKKPAVAHHRPCSGAPVNCRVTDLQDSVATVECREVEAEGLPPQNPSPTTTKVVLPE